MASIDARAHVVAAQEAVGPFGGEMFAAWPRIEFKLLLERLSASNSQRWVWRAPGASKLEV
jgi:hypothetical protein